MPLQSIESTALLPWQFINSVDTNYIVSLLDKEDYKECKEVNWVQTLLKEK